MKWRLGMKRTKKRECKEWYEDDRKVNLRVDPRGRKQRMSGLERRPRMAMIREFHFF